MGAFSVRGGLAGAGAAWVLVCCFTSSGQAQPPYQPASPTLSPWFGLFERSAGPLPSYHYFVRPRQEFQRALQQQQLTTQAQGAALGTLGQELSQIGRTDAVKPTGTGSVFMDYSHYYKTGRSNSVQVRPRNWTPSPPRTAGVAGAY
jgi:hypothetical protein